MKKVALVLVGLLLAAPALATEVDQTKDAQADGKVDIYNLAGDIEVIGWDRSRIQVTGELGDDVEELIFEVSGSQTKIKVKTPDRSWGHKNVSSDITVRVPKASSIDVGSVSADIEVEGVEGDQDLQSVSGDIRTEAFSRDIEAETVSGDVDVSGSGADSEARLESVSGDIQADRLSGELRIGTVSGDLDVTSGDFDRVKAETVNGDIELAMALRNDGRLDVETVNGTVDVGFIGGISARFDIETFNGRIRNCFGPEAERTSKYAPGWELSFSEGGGSGRVTIATLNGGVKICNE